MNTPNNKRRRESIERIEKVFLDQLQTKELGEISVSGICKAAGLNRTTFYANYADVYALADSIRDKLERGVGELYRAERETGANTHEYIKLFQHIRDNQLFYRTYFKLGYDNEYRMLDYDHELAALHFQGRFVEYHVEFFKSGLTKIIKMWLEGGCKESPEDMQEILESEYRGRMEFFAQE